MTAASDRGDRVLLLDRAADGTPDVMYGEVQEVVASPAYTRLFGGRHGA